MKCPCHSYIKLEKKIIKKKIIILRNIYDIGRCLLSKIASEAKKITILFQIYIRIFLLKFLQEYEILEKIDKYI